MAVAHLNDPYVSPAPTDEDYAASVRVLGGRTIIHLQRIGDDKAMVLKALTPGAMDALCMAWIRYRIGADR